MSKKTKILETTTTQALHIAGVRHSDNQGCIKCGRCGKFISYDEMQNDAVCKFTPDSYLTLEKVKWFHKHCA